MCLWLFRSIFIFFEIFVSVATLVVCGSNWSGWLVGRFRQSQTSVGASKKRTQRGQAGDEREIWMDMYCTRVEPTTLDSKYKKKSIINQLIFG